jgi:hypothetical protein
MRIGRGEARKGDGGHVGPPLRDQATVPGHLRRGPDEPPKEIRLEDVLRSLFPLKLRCGLRQSPRHRLESRKLRGTGRCSEAVEGATQDTNRCTVMKIGIMTVQVAQARLKPKWPLLQHKEAVRSHLRESVRDPKLEGHIEARYLEIARESNPAEVVNGGATTRDQLEDPLQAVAPSTRYFQHAPRFSSKSGYAREERQEQRTILGVERNVEKNALSINRTLSFCREHSAARSYLSFSRRLLEEGGSRRTPSRGGSSYSPSSLKILSTISLSSWVTPRVRAICSAVAGATMCFAMPQL